jgi:xanthine dehydrogenase YagR molybdenum-binding subunit
MSPDRPEPLPRQGGAAAALGQPLDRVDGRRKVTGAATYAAEHRQPRLAHAVLVQSTIARGRIAAIDTAAARRAPGVLAVLTHENAPRLAKAKNGEPGEDRLPLADDVVHYAGQHVALVVADTVERARYAASLVTVRYQAEEPVFETSQATALAKAVLPPRLQRRRGDAAAALAAPAAARVREVYTTPVETHNPMEPSATVAAWDGDQLTVADSTQAVAVTRAFLAETFGLPKEKVRVVCPFTGGAFGCKGSQWPHTLLAAMAARVTRRPVALNLTREQMFTSVGHRPATVQGLALAARADGTLIAVSHDTVHATSPTTLHAEDCGGNVSWRLYACGHVAISHRVVRVNLGAPSTMRAPGESPGSFALESAMDELAHALGMDPVELRLRNHAERDPVDGKPWSSKHLRECYARGAARFGWQGRNPRPRSTRDGDLLVGWGMATAFYPAWSDAAAARVRLGADGRALVQTSTHELGTGSYTVFTQLAADALGLPVERVTFELGDSDFPEAPPSYGSQSVASVGEALLRAAAALKAKLLILAAPVPGSPLVGLTPDQVAMADGRLFPAADPGRFLECGDLLRRSGQPWIEAEARVEPGEPAKAWSIHSFGAHFCEVKIDPLLPRVRVTRWVAAVDAGRILNPKTSRSQVIGGVTMGIGMALMEHTVHDPRSGRPVTASLADYAIPVQGDVPAIEVELLDIPDPVMNTLGCRGIGEIGITGVAAAVANAVFHATGRRVRDLPITLDKLL